MERRVEPNGRPVLRRGAIRAAACCRMRAARHPYREGGKSMSKLSRRDFLKGAGVAGAMGAFALGGAGIAFADDAPAPAEERAGNPCLLYTSRCV